MFTDAELNELAADHKFFEDLRKGNFEQKTLFHIKLPKGVDVIMGVAGPSWTVQVLMPPQSDQKGWCGNFNGNPHDDRQVTMGPIDSGVDLFKRVKLTLLEEYGEKPAGKHTCSEELKAKAAKACEHAKLDANVHRGCIMDICLTGDESFAENAMAMELMEVTEGHGMVNFEGLGKCVDENGATFAAIESEESVMRKSCVAIAHVLAHLALKGVHGVQLKEDGLKCQILYTGDSPLETEIGDEIPGLWKQVEAPGDGIGMVSGASDEEGWSCWRILD